MNNTAKLFVNGISCKFGFIISQRWFENEIAIRICEFHARNKYKMSYLVMELCEGGELFDRIIARTFKWAIVAITCTIVEVVQLCSILCGRCTTGSSCLRVTAFFTGLCHGYLQEMVARFTIQEGVFISQRTQVHLEMEQSLTWETVFASFVVGKVWHNFQGGDSTMKCGSGQSRRSTLDYWQFWLWWSVVCLG